MIPRFFQSLLAALLAAALFVSPALAASVEAEPVLTIVATIFPAYDLARALSCGTADVLLLLPPGSESHSYEPTPKDIISIQEADVFLYAGGESDHWVDEILSSLGDAAPLAFRLTDHVSLLEEELSESMQEEADDEHGEEEQDEAEMDEHVWTSPRNMMTIAYAFSSVLCELSPENAAAYTEALEAYLDELQELDAAFTEVVENGKRDIVIFGDRFPFRYFAAEYGLRYDAAFPGCSEDSEPSVRTVVSLVDTVRREDIPVVFYIEFSSRRTADILAEETGAKELLFHSCHNVSAEEMEEGATYLSLMWGNVDALKEALN